MKSAKKASMTPEKARELVRGVVPVVQIKPSFRTISGCLHCTKFHDLESYKSEAKRLGFTEKITYTKGSSEGTFVIYGNKLKTIKDRILCILSGSNASTKVTLGKVTKIDE